MPSISVVMTTYKRDSLLRNTLISIHNQKPEQVIVVDDANDESTSDLCGSFGVTYIPRIGRPDVEFSSPCIPINIGLRAAFSDIVILQNAECRHDSGVVEQFRDRVKEKTALFAKVAELDESGNRNSWYVSKDNPRPFFFCGAMYKKHFDELGGMDEDFYGAGFDDDDFALRAQKSGIKFEFSDDILISHQWHPRPVLSATPMLELYKSKHGDSLWW